MTWKPQNNGKWIFSLKLKCDILNLMGEEEEQCRKDSIKTDRFPPVIMVGPGLSQT